MAYYSQRDPRWANQRLGTCDGITIGSDGCYVDSFANLANDCGKDITPGQLDDIFTNDGMYVNGCLCVDNMLTRVYGDITYSGSLYYPPGVATDLSKLNNDVRVKQIIEVDGRPDIPGLQTHFIYFYDYYNGVVRAIDSWTGQLISVNEVYGDPVDVIYKIVEYRYEGSPTPPAIPVVAVEPEVPPAHVAEPTPAPEAVPVTVTPTPEPAPAPETPTPIVVTVPTPVPTPITPGSQTSEFKITWLIGLLPVVLPIINHYLGTTFTFDQATTVIQTWSQYAVELAAIGGAAWAAVTYIKGRILLKSQR